jgi:hypothetical protein
MKRFSLVIGLTVVWGLGLPRALTAASIIKSYAPNGAALFAQVDGEFRGIEGTKLVDRAFGIPPPEAFRVADPSGPFPPFVIEAAVDPAAVAAPLGTGSVDAAMKAQFEFGAPPGVAPEDVFLFDSLLSASALDALNSLGERANARVASQGSIQFFLDANFGGVAPGTFVGTAEIAAVAEPLDPPAGALVEAFESILGTRTLVGSAGPGDPPLTVNLHAGRGYQLLFKHAFEVPYGTDPTSHVVVSATLSVPEPASMVLWGLGAAALLAGRPGGPRRRSIRIENTVSLRTGRFPPPGKS